MRSRAWAGRGREGQFGGPSKGWQERGTGTGLAGWKPGVMASRSVSVVKGQRGSGGGRSQFDTWKGGRGSGVRAVTWGAEGEKGEGRRSRDLAERQRRGTAGRKPEAPRRGERGAGNCPQGGSGRSARRCCPSQGRVSHPDTRRPAGPLGSRGRTRSGSCPACSRSAPGRRAGAGGGIRPHLRARGAVSGRPRPPRPRPPRAAHRCSACPAG